MALYEVITNLVTLLTIAVAIPVIVVIGRKVYKETVTCQHPKCDKPSSAHPTWLQLMAGEKFTGLCEEHSEELPIPPVANTQAQPTDK